jgi:hypothetical protein
VLFARYARSCFFFFVQKKYFFASKMGRPSRLVLLYSEQKPRFHGRPAGGGALTGGISGGSHAQFQWIYVLLVARGCVIGLPPVSKTKSKRYIFYGMSHVSMHVSHSY